MSNKKGKGPTLFIQQSFSRTPSDTHMQEIYISRQEPEPAQEEIVPTSVKPEQSESVPPSNGATQTDKMHSGFNRVKPFKELSIQERLDYLINYPKVLPMVPCVFYTEDEKILGTLSGADDLQVIIQTADKLEKTIAIKDIKNIIMIGIKR
jgi:hypothetical protein